MAEYLRSYGFIRQEDVDEDSHRVTAVISTEEVARDGAVIHQDGWNFDHFDRNPVVLFGHDDSQPPIARVVEHSVKGKQLTAVSEFDADDEAAMRIFSKIKRGFVNATSVRWNPKTWEFRDGEEENSDDRGKRHDQPPQVLHFLTQELLEFSFVSIPTDPNALIVRADGTAIDVTAYGPDGKTEWATRANDNLPTTREIILDEIDYLRSLIEQYGPEALLARLDGRGQATVDALRGLLGIASSKEEPVRGATTPSLEIIAKEIAELTESLRTAPDIEGRLALALSKQTGRPAEEIRKELVT